MGVVNVIHNQNVIATVVLIKCVGVICMFLSHVLMMYSKHIFLTVLINCRVESNTPAGRELQRLMKVPVDSYDDVLTVLKLENYPSMYKLFDFDGRRSLSIYILQCVLDKNATLSSLAEVNILV